ncbi:MAG: hypothetical protein G3W58_22935 [Pantoea ananatis]|nr:hypothetical protein [Pantoea ananatis]
MALERIKAFEIWLNGELAGYSKNNEIDIHNGFVVTYRGIEGPNSYIMQGVKLSEVYDWKAVPIFEEKEGVGK